MSIETPASDTSGVDLPNDADESNPIVGSDLIEAGEATDKQRQVFLAAAALDDAPNLTASMISDYAGVSETYVAPVLRKAIERDELPSDCTVARECISQKEYDDLTDYQRRIINEMALNPDSTQAEVAEVVGCTPQYVSRVLQVYGDLVDEVQQVRLPDEPTTDELLAYMGLFED